MCGSDKEVAMGAQSMHPEESEEQLVERVGGYVAGACNVMMIALADKLGVFKHMAGKKAAAPAQIAEQMGLSERWVRELLYQLAAARVVSTDEAASTFWLTPAQARVLAYENCEEATDSLLAPVCTEVALGGKIMDKLAEAFHTGKGLKYDDYGHEMACAICREFGAWTRNHLLNNIQKIPGMHELLSNGATVADVGCGCGEALRVLGTAYPASTFHGYDISKRALGIAKENCAHLNNVSFRNPEVEGEGMPDASYDFIITLDAVHDMARPDLVLEIVRKGLKDDAAGYLVSDPKSLGTPAANIKNMAEDAMVGYAYSVMVCMSSALSEEGGMGLGTLGWHPELAKSMLLKAGFKSVEQLGWESGFNTFYHATL